jgi:hypothetical protein
VVTAIAFGATMTFSFPFVAVLIPAVLLSPQALAGARPALRHRQWLWRRGTGRDLPVPRLGVCRLALPGTGAERGLADGQRMAAALGPAGHADHCRVTATADPGPALLRPRRACRRWASWSPSAVGKTVKYLFLAWATARYPARFMRYN